MNRWDWYGLLFLQIVAKIIENNWGKVLFCIDIIRNFAIANKLQWRPSAAAQQRPSEFASAFALHDGCTVITHAGIGHPM